MQSTCFRLGWQKSSRFKNDSLTVFLFSILSPLHTFLRVHHFVPLSPHVQIIFYPKWPRTLVFPRSNRLRKLKQWARKQRRVPSKKSCSTKETEPKDYPNLPRSLLLQWRKYLLQSKPLLQSLSLHLIKPNKSCHPFVWRHHQRPSKSFVVLPRVQRRWYYFHQRKLWYLPKKLLTVLSHRRSVGTFCGWHKTKKTIKWWDVVVRVIESRSGHADCVTCQ